MRAVRTRKIFVFRPDLSFPDLPLSQRTFQYRGQVFFHPGSVVDHVYHDDLFHSRPVRDILGDGGAGDEDIRVSACMPMQLMWISFKL